MSCSSSGLLAFHGLPFGHNLVLAIHQDPLIDVAPGCHGQHEAGRAIRDRHWKATSVNGGSGSLGVTGWKAADWASRLALGGWAWLRSRALDTRKRDVRRKRK
jgi:hypothetical protein